MIVLAALTLAWFQEGSPGARAPFAALTAELAQRASEQRFAGVVGVGRGDEVLYLRGFGLASVELGVPHAPETRFKLHSLSKPLLATVLMRSVEVGRVELDAPAGEYLEAWPSAWSEVTVASLAQHTSGIPDFAERFLDEWNGSARSTWAALAPSFAAQTAEAVPSSTMRYSNAGYVLLAALLETVWDAPLAELMERELFRPAGMRTATLEELRTGGGYSGAAVLTNLATGYNGAPDALQVAHSKTYAIPGAAGVVCSAGDLLAFARALDGGKLLGAEAWTRMTTVAPGQSAPYALGWVVRARGEQRALAHDGGNNGFVTSLEFEPEAHLALVILSNLGFVDMTELRGRVAELVHAELASPRR
ncbi:MAG: serine hydrolase domain-containing protein [Planctomycetota bacterium]